MKKYKELFKNIGILTLSNFGSKLLGFFLVPLYTAVLTTEEYGNFDFITTTVSLLIPILTINLSEGALRFLLDKKCNKENIISITFKYTLLSIVIIIIVSVLNHFFNFFPLINNNLSYFIMYYIVSALNIMMQNIVRGLDKVKNVAIGGIINSTLMFSLNILFLLVFKLGLIGYFWATILSNFISFTYLFFSVKIYKLNLLKQNDKKLLKKMTNYSKPLMLNSIAWWINSVSDRYVVIYLCGLAANGIYSVAYKIPSILSVFQNIFNQAWSISSVKEFDAEDKNNFFSNTYLTYNFLMVICCSIILFFSKLIAHILYLKDFYGAWLYTPFLMISVVFGALSGWLGGIYSAVKNSKIIGRTTIIGAIINIIFNFILVYFIGIMGAAISTALSYFIVWLVRFINLKKYIKLKVNVKTDFAVYLLLIFQCISIILIQNELILYSTQILFIILILCFYRNIIKKIIMWRKSYE